PYPANPLWTAFDLSGRRIAVCGSNWVVICETETGTSLFRIDRGLDTLSFSPDGKKILGGNSGKLGALGAVSYLTLFDLETGNTQATESVVESVLVGPDGRYFVTRNLDYSVRIWDFQSFREIGRRS